MSVNCWWEPPSSSQLKEKERWESHPAPDLMLLQVPLNTPNPQPEQTNRSHRSLTLLSPAAPSMTHLNSETFPWKQLLHTDLGTSPGTAQSPKEGSPHPYPLCHCTSL